MVGLLSRDDRSVGGKREVDTRVGHQVSLREKQGYKICLRYFVNFVNFIFVSILQSYS